MRASVAKLYFDNNKLRLYNKRNASKKIRKIRERIWKGEDEWVTDQSEIEVRSRNSKTVKIGGGTVGKVCVSEIRSWSTRHRHHRRRRRRREPESSGHFGLWIILLCLSVFRGHRDLAMALGCFILVSLWGEGNWKTCNFCGVRGGKPRGRCLVSGLIRGRHPLWHLKKGKPELGI